MENLVWAPNSIIGQHNLEALERVVNGLSERAEFGEDYDLIVDYLNEMGQIASGR